MEALYPLRFHPIFRRYLWGGRRLQTVLGKQLGEGTDYAESWEVVDRDDDQSTVQFGALEGKTLRNLNELYGRDLTGRAGQGSFPLLLKFLDANQRLSVQVHPDDERGKKLVPPDLGKTEAWYIVHADPGSVVYAGLKRGFDRAALDREIRRGTTELCMHRFEPQAGDCIFIPAGVVHALGAGLVVAEIQQASDTTYRLFDWNRTGPDGKPRALHIEQGLEAIDFTRGPIHPQRPSPTQRDHVRRLVECEYFVWDEWQFDRSVRAFGDGHCHLLAVIEGSVTVSGDPAGQPLRRGDTMLVPASIGQIELVPNQPTKLLDAWMS